MTSTQDILFTVCTHGNEPLGLHLFDFPNLNVHIANPQALMKRTRYIDEDLNRAFDHIDANGTYEQRLASLLTPTLRSYNAVIDIHQTDSAMEDCIFINNRTPTVDTLISSFDARHVIIDDDTSINGKYLTSVNMNSLCVEYTRDTEAQKRLVTDIKRLSSQQKSSNKKTYSRTYKIVPLSPENMNMSLSNFTRLTPAQKKQLHIPAGIDCMSIFVREHAYPTTLCVVNEILDGE